MITGTFKKRAKKNVWHNRVFPFSYYLYFIDLAQTFRGPYQKEERNEMFYLTKHSTHFIYGYLASDMW